MDLGEYNEIFGEDFRDELWRILGGWKCLKFGVVVKYVWASFVDLYCAKVKVKL